MKRAAFKIGLDFRMSGSMWRCTDVGTRSIAAIQIDYREDQSWFDGPPYDVVEYVIDERDFPACTAIRCSRSKIIKRS